MKSVIPLRFTLCSSCLAALPLLGGLAIGQGGDDQKIEPVPKSVQDIKPQAEIHPVKTDAPPPVSQANAGERSDKDGHDAGGGFVPPDLSNRVLFDEPGDGALWVRGGDSYKARFDSEGATYIPNFGSRAPKGYPVTFTLQEVRIGTELQSMDASAPYERADNIVSYDRGNFTEVYDVSPDTIEQLFVFDDIGTSGDLVVRIDVNTEMTFVQTSDGFVFENEYGHVRYGRATVVDGVDASLLVESTFEDGVIEIRVPASFLASASLPLTIDPVISTFSVDTDDTVNATSSDVAYDQTNNRYTVVWEQVFNATDHDIYSVLLTSTGSLVPSSEVTIDFTTGCWTHPRVANNQIADLFLVVSQTSPSCASPWIIEGRTRNASSNTTGSQFQISGTFSGDKLRPDVGGDPVTTGPTYFCVVWERAFSSTDHDVHYQMVRADSTLLNATTQLLENDTDDQRNPTVSKSDGQRPFSTQGWNVVWEEIFSSSDHDIYGGQILWNGDITNFPFLIDFSASDDRRPEASSLLNETSVGVSRDYLVAYDRGSGIANDIQGRVCNNGATVSFSTNLSLLDSPFATTRDQIQPALDTDGTCFALVYSEQFGTSTTDYDIYISTITWNGSTLGVSEAHQNLAFSVDAEYSPRITANLSAVDGTPGSPNRFMATWTDQFTPFSFFPGNGDIEGGLYDTVCSACNTATGNYCSSAAFSSGVSIISVSPDVVSISGNPTMTASANNLPANQPGIFIAGPTQAAIPFFNGTLCIGQGGLQRFSTIHIPVAGNVVENFTIGGAALGGLNVSPNQAYHFQFWCRDPAAGGGNANFSNAYTLCFTP